MSHIMIISNREPEPLKLSAFVDLAEYVLKVEGAPEASEVSIAIVDESEIAELNERYRHKEGPTDVLSFPCDEVAAVVAEGEPLTLGDVILAPAIAEANARELGNTIEAELNLLVVHGVLHLLGYDHIEDDEAAVMQAREKSILEAWELQA